VQEEIVLTKQSQQLVGQLLADRYEILSLVGEGGMGLVYKARHVLMNRLVAIKTIRAELVANQTMLQRFQQEAMAISKLHHPNIVTVYDFGVSLDGITYLAMDYLDGTSLADLLNNEGKLTLERTMPLFLQACHGLKHAHDNGIIHRDFKASNLMVCQEADGREVVKIVDFGMAKLMRLDTEGRSAQELTQLGEVFGSPLYMSPEQCKGQKLDERSDIYSLACVFYYALAGRPPFLGDNVLDTLQKQIHDEADPPSNFQSGISLDLDAIILKCLRKDPDERYQNMSQILMDLEAVNNGDERLFISQRFKPPRRKRKSLLSHNFEANMVFAIVLGAVLIALTAFMSGRMFQQADEDIEMNTWVDRNLDGDKARMRHEYEEAEHAYQLAVAEAYKFGANDPRAARSLVSLGKTFLEDKKYVQAETSLKRAIAIIERVYGQDCFEESDALMALSEVYEVQNKVLEAKSLRERAETCMESTVGRSKFRRRS
jgi:serine/threonine protein kinase